MKRHFLFLSLMAVAASIFAQTSWPQPCGTTYTPEQMEAFYQRDRSHLYSQAKSGEELTMPIYYHLVADDNGNGRFSYEDMLRLHCELNEYYDSLNIRFFIAGWKEIDNTTFYQHNTFSVGRDMMLLHGVSNVCNVFIDDNAGGACGYYSPGLNFVVLRKSCSLPNSTTFPHEIGHFLNLPHTFSGWENRDYTIDPLPITDWERVDGSNCVFTGDGFCDTPPDYESDRWSCSPGPTFTDPAGVDFTPDASYFMSYSSDACQSRFSPEQIAEMRNYLEFGRQSNLNVVPALPDDSVGQAQILFPLDGNEYLPAGETRFRWHAAPNATHYLLQLTETNFFNPTVEIILQDTQWVYNLERNENYRWRIKPFQLGYACASFSDEAVIGTSNLDITITKEDVSCPDGNDGRISVTLPALSSSSFNWSSPNPFLNAAVDAATGSSVIDLAPGIYHLNIATIPTDSISTEIIIEGVDPVEITHRLVDDNQVLIDITGGTPPYNVTWENGQFGLLNTEAVVGDNNLTISDANGCLIPKTVNLTSVNASVRNLENEKRLTIYPNPVTGNTVNVRNDFTNEQGSFRVVDGLGSDIPVTVMPIQNGYQLTMDSPYPGVYSIIQQTNDGTFVGRLLIR